MAYITRLMHFYENIIVYLKNILRLYTILSPKFNCGAPEFHGTHFKKHCLPE